MYTSQEGLLHQLHTVGIALVTSSPTLGCKTLHGAAG